MAMLEGRAVQRTGECHAICRDLAGSSGVGCKPDHRLQLLSGGEAYVPAMLAAIVGAHDTIDLELYRAHPGHLWQLFEAALADAVARSVRVRLLLDAFGSRGLDSLNRRRVLSAGIELRIIRTVSESIGSLSSRRDHRKLLIIDGTLAFTGGMSIDDTFYRNPQEPTWHEVMVCVEGAVVEDMQLAFERSWSHHFSRSVASLQHPVKFASEARVGIGAHLICSDQRTRSGEEFFLRAIDNARLSVLIMNPFVIPTRKILTALTRAASNGVDVRLLVPGRYNRFGLVRIGMRSFYATLLAAGVRVLEYQRSMLHAKMMVVDEHWSSIGSFNLDPRSIFCNDELALGTCDREFAHTVANEFYAGCEDAVEVHMKQWRSRALGDRLQELAVRLIRSHL